MNWFLFCILAYVLLQLVVCFFITRRMKSEQDYMLAGRSLGLSLGAMTIFATWFGAETCIGAAGVVYEDGLAGGRADPFGYVLCIFILGVFFARKLWIRKLTTFGDFFRQRFGVGVEKIAVLLIVPTSVIWAAAQIRAFGQVLSASSDLSPEFAITFAASIVIAYTVMGGLLADVVSDLIQGVVLILGLVILALAVFWNMPSGDIFAQAFSPERLRLKSPDETWLSLLDGWSIPVIGSLFSAELATRIMASKNPTIARNASILGGSLYLCIGIIPVFFGMLGAALIPGLDDPEQILPLIAQQYLSPVFYVIFAGALVSAILSTVDSALLAAGSLISHNIVIPFVPGADERHKVRYARIAVFCFGIIAYYMALQAEGVDVLVEYSSSFASAGVFTCCVMGLCFKRGGKFAAGASLITGVTAFALNEFILQINYAYTITLLLSVGIYLILMIFEPGTDTFVEKAEVTQTTAAY